MAIRRKTDVPQSRARYRSERLVKEGGQWYFHTREGTLEGPFDSEQKAKDQLETYIKLVEIDLLPSEVAVALRA